MMYKSSLWRTKHPEHPQDLEWNMSFKKCIPTRHYILTKQIQQAWDPRLGVTGRVVKIAFLEIFEYHLFLTNNYQFLPAEILTTTRIQLEMSSLKTVPDRLRALSNELGYIQDFMLKAQG